ncbi:MAG: TraR/DksA C4-type zinc finger protein [Flavobacteriia bacterium]|nr:TraR/DksA C4-type zinc finger protein [Flavobacteriia bacterium]
MKKKPIAKSAPKKVVAKAAAKAGTKKVAVKKAPPKTTAPAKVVKKAVSARGKHEEVKKPVAKAPAARPKKETAKPTVKTAPPKAKTRKGQAVEEPKADKPLVTVGAGPSLPRVTPMVAVQVSTLEAGDKERYSDAELEEFRTIINAKLDEARRDYDLLKQTLANTDNNGTEDTSPSFKMIEDGSETLGREETAQLAGRQEKFIKHLEDALLRIRNKTYGICRVTGKLISKERLRLVPHATLSIEAKQQMSN